MGVSQLEIFSTKRNRVSCFHALAALSAAAVLNLVSHHPSFAQDSVGVEQLKSEVLREQVKANDGQVSVSDLDRAARKLRAAEDLLLQQGKRDEHANSTSESLGEPGKTQRVEQAPDSAQNLPPVVKITGSGTAVSAALPASNSAASSPASQQNADLQKNLDGANARIAELLKQLDETRNRLIIAETQVERLSSIIDGQAKTSATSARDLNVLSRNVVTVASSSAVNQSGATYVARPVSNPSPPRVEPRAISSNEEDMQIATVVADKAHLRSGPGKDNSPLMAVSKGTRLVVETRNGEWYRVITPTGTRAWVSSDVVAFGVGGKNASPTQATRVKGYDSELDHDSIARR